MASFSRRSLLRVAAVGATAGALAVPGLLDAAPVYAEATSSSYLTTVFDILATGEALFTTLYRLGAANHAKLGINGYALNALLAIRTEEQIHFNFVVANGGTPLTTHFSFPMGSETFTDRGAFLATFELAEELTNSALLALIQDLAARGLVRLTQIAGQLMSVEGGHRVVSRVIRGEEPADNWAFGPALLQHFTDVPAAVTKAGFLSPRPGNDFAFVRVSDEFPGVINTTPVHV
ncbi:MAG: ferritin-like domain-containing protein [Ktedonobacterales bacterium]